MNNKLRIIFTLLCFSQVIHPFAANIQTNKSNGWCGSEAPSIEWESRLQRIISYQKKNNILSRKTEETSYTIPVIVHVCYQNQTQNISAAQVQSQIDALNKDYAGTGLNSNTVPTAFAPLKADTKVSFCLAKLGPNNNILAEPGINRISISSKGWTNPGTKGWGKDYIDLIVKPQTIWDPNFYLNIWVVPAIAGSGSGTLLGYATFPALTGLPGLPSGSGDPLDDGIVCRSSYFGNGVGIATNSKGRTTTHEIGHWLGLRHISGDEVCGDDFVDDTPTQKGGYKNGPNGLNYNCPSYPFQVNGCGPGSNPNGEMFMNFMDYTSDNCMSMFTIGQAERFHATLQYGEYRKNLINSPVCNTTPIKPFAKFSYTKNLGALCPTSQTYDFADKSNFAPTSWTWKFQGGTPSSSTQKNPTGIVFNTSGIHNITLIASNAVGSDTIVQQVVVPIVGNAALPFHEDFEGIFPPNGWDFVNRNGNLAVNWESMYDLSAYGIGNQCMRFNNTMNDAKLKRDDIMTPRFDFTGFSGATLTFDIAYTPYYGPIVADGPDVNLWDTLEVLITNDCQTSTQQIYRKGNSDLATVMPGQGDEFYPLPNQWRTETVAIPSSFLNKKNVQIIFRNYGDYGHTIYIDNVNITTATSIPTATASFTVSDTTVCVGGSLLFTNTSTASAGSPDSVRWTIPGGTPSTSTSTTTVAPTFNTAGTYTISLVAYKSGNASAAYTKTIRVKAKPTVSVNSPTICSGENATLTASGATSYTWRIGATSASIVVNPTNTTTYTVTGTTNGCSNDATATVTIKAVPVFPIITQSGDTMYSSTINAGATYEWYKNESLIPASNAPYIKITSGGSYTVKVIDGNCFSTSEAFTAIYTGIKNATNSIQLLEVYPNPTDGRMIINLNLTKSAAVQIYIYSTDGRVLYNHTYSNVSNVNEELNLRDLSQSLYILRLQVNDEIYYHKIVKH